MTEGGELEGTRKDYKCCHQHLAHQLPPRSEGNEIKKVLRSLDSMELVLPSDLTPFLAYFRAFKKVRDAAFTSYPH